MPRSDPKNPTIEERHATYSEDFKISNNVVSIDDFIREIDAGKAFLRAYKNTLIEHDILCVWRLVIFSNHSIVQNYFPNWLRAESFNAPMFVYTRGVSTGVEANAYYDAHVSMFELIKKRSLTRPVQPVELVDTVELPERLSQPLPLPERAPPKLLDRE